MNNNKDRSISRCAPQKENGIPKNKKRCDYRAFLWILPAFLLLCVFNYIPPVLSAVTSFWKSNGVTMIKFVGFKNYADVLKDQLFLTSFKNVLIITVCTFIFSHAANLLLAELLINLKWQRLSAIYRILFVIPIVVPGIVGLMIWQKLIFVPAETGLANIILSWFGLNPQGWYFSEKTVLLSIILTGFPWAGGTTMLIYIASLQGISPEMIEATKLDGVGPFKRVIHFHIPMMIGQIKYFIITSIIGGMQNFNLQLIVTGGGPGVDGASMVPGYQIYYYAFTKSDYGRANALGIVLFVIIMVLTIINNVFIKNKNTEEVDAQ